MIEIEEAYARIIVWLNARRTPHTLRLVIGKKLNNTERKGGKRILLNDRLEQRKRDRDKENGSAVIMLA